MARKQVVRSSEAVSALKTVVNALGKAQTRTKSLEERRDELIVGLLHDGHSTREVAAVAKVTQARIVQINAAFERRHEVRPLEVLDEPAAQ